MGGGLNIRFGSRHLQINPYKPHFSFAVNPYHAKGGEARSQPGWKWFEVYL